MDKINGRISPPYTAAQQVNRIGKAIYNNLEGAFKFVKSSNSCDIYTTVLYEVPGSNEVEEMTLDINLTTYQNKVRVNIIEMDEYERTIGFDLYRPEDLDDTQVSVVRVLNKVKHRIIKAFQNYNFLF